MHLKHVFIIQLLSTHHVYIIIIVI